MQFPRVVEWWGKERPPCIIGTSVTKEFDVMEMVCQLPCLSILQTPWGHDLDENSVQASSILKPPWWPALPGARSLRSLTGAVV